MWPVGEYSHPPTLWTVRGMMYWRNQRLVHCLKTEGVLGTQGASQVVYTTPQALGQLRYNYT